MLKADRDFTKETDAAIPEAESMAKVLPYDISCLRTELTVI